MDNFLSNETLQELVYTTESLDLLLDKKISRQGLSDDDTLWGRHQEDWVPIRCRGIDPMTWGTADVFTWEDVEGYTWDELSGWLIRYEADDPVTPEFELDSSELLNHQILERTYNKEAVDNLLITKIEEAPINDYLYGRCNGEWVIIDCSERTNG
jgi:hypothetical protein